MSKGNSKTKQESLLNMGGLVIDIGQKNNDYYNKGSFMLNIDLYLKTLYNVGVISVFITINKNINITDISTNNNVKQVISENDLLFEEFLKQDVNLELGDYSVLEISEKNLIFLNQDMLKICNFLKENVELLEYCFCVLEKSKGGMMHYHYLVGIKSILGYNPILSENIKTLLYNYLGRTSNNMVWAKTLFDFKSINKSAYYIFKRNYLFINQCDSDFIKKYIFCYLFFRRDDICGADFLIDQFTSSVCSWPIYANVLECGLVHGVGNEFSLS